MHRRRDDAIAETVDPDNQLYWHFDRRRLTAERTRDAMLFVSGKLNPQMYGPGVRPKLPEGFNVRRGVESDARRSSAANRRSVYIYAKRNLPYPMLQDVRSSRHERKLRAAGHDDGAAGTSLLNSQFVLDASRSFASTVRKDVTTRHDKSFAGRTPAFDRTPSDEALKSAARFLAKQESRVHDGAKERSFHPRSRGHRIQRLLSCLIERERVSVCGVNFDPRSDRAQSPASPAPGRME